MDKESLELSKIVGRYWRLIAILTGGLVLVTGIVSFLWTPSYEATATLIVQTNKSSTQNQFNNVLADQKLVKTYEDVIASNRIAEDVIHHLHLQMTVEDLLNEVTVTAPTDSLVTSITVRDDNPNQAVRIANGFADSFYRNIDSIMPIDNVSILDRAELGSDLVPVSPKPYFDMAVALVVGPLLGVALSFLLEFLDNTIKSEQEVEALLGIPVLGEIPRYDMNKEMKKIATVPDKKKGTGVTNPNKRGGRVHESTRGNKQTHLSS